MICLYHKVIKSHTPRQQKEICFNSTWIINYHWLQTIYVWSEYHGTQYNFCQLLFLVWSNGITSPNESSGPKTGLVRNFAFGIVQVIKDFILCVISQWSTLARNFFRVPQGKFCALSIILVCFITDKGLGNFPFPPL